MKMPVNFDDLRQVLSKFVPWMLVCLTIIVVATLLTGGGFQGHIGSNEFELVTIEKNVSQLQHEMVILKQDFDRKLAEIKKNLAFHAVWDKGIVLSESAYFEKLCEQLMIKTQASAVTIWLLGQPLEVGDRYLLAAWPKNVQGIIASKASKGWPESSWRAESIVTGRHIAVINNIRDFEQNDVLGIPSKKPYKVYNGTEFLSNAESKKDIAWNDELGNMVFYATGKIGIKPIYCVAIDYNTKNNADVKTAMRNAIENIEPFMQKVTNKMVKLNPSVLELKYLTDLR